jgi:microcystin degradation protein MlrC
MIDMRVITGCIGHETNTFSNVISDLSRFKEMGIAEGDEFFKVYRGTRSIGGAFIEVSEAKGYELIPTVWNNVFAWGLVTDDALEYMLDKLLSGIKSAGKIDGVLLQLHGAMVTESHEDAEAYILQKIRALVGESMPIIATLDLHANLTKDTVDAANILVGYDTYPHVDPYERGLEAAELMFRMLKKEINPVAAFRKPPLMTSPQVQKTSYYPMKSVYDLAHKIEEDGRVLNVTVLPGYPFADISCQGMNIIVTTNGDRALAEEKAQQIADYAWSIRRHFLADVVPVDIAVKRAIEAKEGPIILADQADNPGGGAPCDGTAILQELIRQKAKNVVICVIRDPEAVENAIKAGVGNKVTMKIGGKTDKLHGEPVTVTGYVKLVSDGTFVRKSIMGRGLVTKLGRTVVLDVDGIEIMLTERREQPTDLEQYRAFGIEPTDKKIIVVKSAVHYRAVHEPIAKEIIEVDGPGIHGTRLAGFNYKHVPRPIFPIDLEMIGISELRKSISEI